MKNVDMELQEKLVEYLKDNKSLMLGGMAEKFNVNDWKIAESLPYELSGIASAEKFDEIWEELTKWQKCTFLMMHLGTALELQGTIPMGKHGHGYFNVSHADGGCISGHLKVDDLKGIAFISLNGKERGSMHIAFFNNDEEIKFAIFAGRENRELIPSVKESFFAMKDKFCEK